MHWMTAHKKKSFKCEISVIQWSIAMCFCFFFFFFSLNPFAKTTE